MNHPFQPSVYRRQHGMLIAAILVGAFLVALVVSIASQVGAI